jgi:hypothetical protein
MVVAGYYKKALMAVCLCIALFAGNGSVRGQGPGVRDQGSELARRQSGGVRGQSLPAVSLAGSEARSRACSPNRPIDFEKKGSPGTASTEEIFEYFNGFIVHIKRGDFHHRILVCDVVIELNRGMKLPQERIELRKIIYNTLKGLSESPEIRRSLKEEIKTRLNNFMNDEIIKNVYFTKFVLL